MAAKGFGGAVIFDAGGAEQRDNGPVPADPAFASPEQPQRSGAIMTARGLIDEHPPPRLRVFMACRVLHHLGRHEQADRLWQQWQNDHSQANLFYLPLGGKWAGLSDDVLTSVAETIVDTMLEQPWPELGGYELMNIPGLAYLHADHAAVQRLMPMLSQGLPVEADPRRVVAAAVLATAAAPDLHAEILSAAKHSIAAADVAEASHEAADLRDRPASMIRNELRRSLRDRAALHEAIMLGAALTRHRRPGRRE